MTQSSSQVWLEGVETLLNHRFTDPAHITEALTHSSFSNELAGQGVVLPADNERLEYLGDAVLGLVVAELLMERYPQVDEGWLSKWRSSLVSRKTLAEIALGLNLGIHLRLGRGEQRSGGALKPSILASALEAVVGALYLDGGVGAARAFLERVFEGRLDNLLVSRGEWLDRKTHLQEKTQFHFRSTPEYRVVDSWGREHEKTFRVEIWIQGKSVAVGEGRSKKEAEQAAAELALNHLEF